METNDNISEYIEGCIPSDLLLKYIKGELSGPEKNRIERHLSSCEMCSDELEGLSIMENPERIEGISNELNQQIDALTAKPRREIPNLGLYLRVAASIVLILGVSTIIYFTAFRKSSPLLPNYAMMEIESPKSVKEPNKDLMKMDMAAEAEKMEDLAKESKPSQENIGGNRKEEREEEIRYVAPVVVDSISDKNADKSIVENDEMVAFDTTKFKMAEVVEDNQVADEKLDQPVTVAAEMSTKSARGVLAKKDLASGISASKEKATFETYNERKETALDLFSKEKYKDAVIILNKLYSEFPERDTIAFYASLSNFNLKRYNETIDRISFLAISPNSPFYGQAEWYYALALIKVDRKDEAKVVLNRLINENSPLKENAKKELKKLEAK